ncbi:MAG: hypothetical protein EXR11_01165 [Rhodospirillaceae bacterium]|nr:hypothetical protein [Rhodospirillaceae bacterium]
MVEMTFNQALIFVPMLMVVALTIAAFIRLAYVRVRTLRMREMPLKYYTAFQGGTEPEYVTIAARHYMNLFEAPVVFYLACLTAYAVEAVTPGTYFTAWAYVVFRLAQSAIHLTYNNVRHRAYAFFLGWIALTVLWVQIARSLLAHV